MKHVVKYGGIGVALGLDSYIIYDSFIMQDVNYKHKIGFIGLLALFIVFMIVWGWVNKKINMKLQAISTANEMGVVGQTSLLWKTLLNFIGVIIPLVLVGGMFYYVGAYFNQIGGAILKIAAITLIPMVAYYFAEYIHQNELTAMRNAEQEALIKGVADEVKRTVGYK
jgi:hypothetical protein